MVGEGDDVTGGDSDDEDGGIGYRGWIDPDDRLWRHPSEMGALASGGAATRPPHREPPLLGPGGRRPTRPGRARHVTTVAVSMVVAVTAAALAVAAAADRASTPASQSSVLLSATPTTSASVRNVPMTGAGRTALGLRPSLVLLVVRNHGHPRIGTGVVAESGGIVVTSASLIGTSRRITAVEADGTWGPATVVGTSAAGLAVLRVGDDLPPAAFTDNVPATGSAELAVAVHRGSGGSGPKAEVYAGTVTDGDAGGTAPVGNAGGSGGTGGATASTVETAASSGPLASGGAVTPALATAQLDAPLGATELGCALTGRDGQVAGLLTSAGDPGSGRAATFVPAVLVVHVVSDLVSSGSVTTGQLGVTAADTPGGARVVTVAADGSAALGGIMPGDVITSVDGAGVHSVDQLHTALYGDPPGTEITLGITRGGRASTTDTVLEAPAPSAAADPGSSTAF